MKTRTDLLNHLAQKYKLERYLEIGVQNVDQNFNKIVCPIKRGVDPQKVGIPTDDNAVIIHVTSDEYFKGHDSFFGENYDLIFIDGLHTAEQVKKDFENALKILSRNGFIVLHDCNPLKEEHTIVPRPTKTGHWNGSVYKTACYIVNCCGLDDSGCYAQTVDIDNGCLVFNRDFQSYINVFETWELSDDEWQNWSEFDKNRKELLNLITWDEFIAINSHV